MSRPQIHLQAIILRTAAMAGAFTQLVSASVDAQEPGTSPPGPAATVAAASPARPALLAADAEVPFDFSQGVVLMEVECGGSRPAHLMLDTGDADSLLDVEAARAIGLKLDMSQLKVAGSGEGAVTYYNEKLPRLRIGSAEFSNMPIVIMPVSKNLLDDSGIHCEGTLGYDFFKGCVLQIDYPARKLRLLTVAPPADARLASAGADLPIQWRKYHAQSPLLITTDALHVGNKNVCAQLDTCFSHSVLFFTTKLPWLERRPVDNTPPAHYEEATLPAVNVPDPITLGNLSFQANPIVYAAGAEAHIPETEIAAVIGNRFFQNGVLTLDLRADRVRVEWSAAPAPTSPSS